VVAGLDNSSRLAQEEIFGPVLVVIPHDGDDDAVRIATTRRTGSPDPWTLVARACEGRRGPDPDGTLAVNGGGLFSPDAPFVVTSSRDRSRDGRGRFEEYLETKTIAEPA